MALPSRAGGELKGGIFNDRQTKFVHSLVLPDLALKALLHAAIGFG